MHLSSMQPNPLFLVPFQRNVGFIGREEDLVRVHIALQRQGPVGICPSPHVSTVGIGKTQLTIEYLYRYQKRYPEGIFWINAARPLAQEFAELGHALWVLRSSPIQTDDDLYGRQQLMNLISQHFDEEGLKDLCFHLNINYYQLSNRGKLTKIRELIAAIEQDDRTYELLEYIHDIYPQAFADPLDMTTVDEPNLDQLIQIAFQYLKTHPHSLLVLDNVTDTKLLKQPIGYGIIPALFPCSLLFTTRQRHLEHYHTVGLDVLPEEEAVTLLLSSLDRQAVLSKTHPEHEIAKQITAVLGHLPLSLQIAGTYLDLQADTPLADYEQALYRWGSDPLTSDIRLVHRQQAGMMATLTGQWNILSDEMAQLLLRIAGQLPAVAPIPIARLALFLGFTDLPRQIPQLKKAIHALQDLAFASRISENLIQIQPLVQAFGQNQTLPPDTDAFRLQCVRHLIDAFENFDVLKKHITHRGVEGVQADLLAALDLLPRTKEATNLNERIQILIRLLQREVRFLTAEQIAFDPIYFAQRIHYRCVDMGLGPLTRKAYTYLNSYQQNSILIQWVAKRESLRLEHSFANHEGGVLDVAITPDGRYAISASEDSTLKVWNLATGREERTLIGHEAWVQAVVVTPDGQHVLSASEDETICVWNLATGHLERTLVGHTDVVNAVTVTPDNHFAISASWDNTLKVWNLISGQEIHTFTGHTDFVQAITTNPDGRFLISASRDGTFKVWEIRTGDHILTVPQPKDLVQAIAATSDRHRAISTSSEGLFRVWNLNNGEIERALETKERLINAIAVSQEGDRAISGTSFGTLKVWDMKTGQLEHTLNGHTDSVRSVAITPDGRRAISASKDTTIKVWDLSHQRPHGISSGHDAAVLAIAVTPDGERAISASEDGTLKVWHLQIQHEELTLKGHNWPVNAVVATPDNQRVISVSLGGILKVWDLLTTEVQFTLEGYRAVTVTPNGRLAITASFDYTLIAWDLTTGEKAFTIPTTQDAVQALTILPDGQAMLAAYQSGTIKQWDLKTKTVTQTFDNHTWAINSIIITPDGQQFISASDDGTLTVSQLAQGQVTQTFKGHQGRVLAVAVNHDGSQIVSAARDSTLKAWSLQNGRELTSLALDNILTCIAISPSDDTIITGDKQGNLYFLRCVQLPR